MKSADEYGRLGTPAEPGRRDAGPLLIIRGFLLVPAPRRSVEARRSRTPAEPATT